MKSIARWLALLLFVVTAVACQSDQQDCPEGTVECTDGLCHECCIDDDCPGKIADCPQEFTACSNDYECECTCLEEGEDCSGNLDVCCTDLNCEMEACMPPCTDGRDCFMRYFDRPFRNAIVCEDGVCIYLTCEDDMDCPVGRCCIAGYCADGCDSEIRECVVLPNAALTKNGTTAQFAVTAYLRSGAVAPGFTFDWESSDESVASVDDNGLVTGGTETGEAIISARLAGCCSIICEATVSNYGNVTAGQTRVITVDDLSGIPVEGATIALGAEAPVVTDTNGVAEFSVELNAGNPQDITVSKQDYNYVTLKGVKTNDVFIHMNPLYHRDFSQNPPAKQAGGIKGTFSFDLIRCEPPLQTCDVSLALAGLSIPPSLTNLGLDMLDDGVIMTEVQLGGNTELMPFAPGFVWCLSQTCFKDSIQLLRY